MGTTITIIADPIIIDPQPDTDLMIQHLHGFTEEFTKLPNVPALAEGNAIQQLTAQVNVQFAQVNAQINAQFAQVNAQMNAQFAQVTAQFTQVNAQFAQVNAQFAQVNAQFAQRFDQLDNKIDTLAIRVAANDHNASARVQNSYLTRSSDRLTPLMSSLTNTLIEWFPMKSSDIPNIEDQGLDTILQELGLPTNGEREAKEKRLRQSIGLRPRSTGA